MRMRADGIFFKEHKQSLCYRDRPRIQSNVQVLSECLVKINVIKLAIHSEFRHYFNMVTNLNSFFFLEILMCLHL